MSSDIRVVFCTCPNSSDAERIANCLVTENLAACVNIVPGLTSVFRWQDEIQRDTEWLLVIKTTINRYQRLEARVAELHPYEVPEIIAMGVEQGLPAYLDWVRNGSIN